MPSRIKLGLSILVAIVAIGVHIFQGRVGQVLDSWLALGLGAFMIFAMWLFPEAGGKKRTDKR